MAAAEKLCPVDAARGRSPGTDNQQSQLLSDHLTTLFTMLYDGSGFGQLLVVLEASTFTHQTYTGELHPHTLHALNAPWVANADALRPGTLVQCFVMCTGSPQKRYRNLAKYPETGLLSCLNAAEPHVPPPTPTNTTFFGYICDTRLLGMVLPKISTPI